VRETPIKKSDDLFKEKFIKENNIGFTIDNLVDAGRLY